MKRNPAAAPVWQPNATQHSTSFAGTDGFAYFCQNKSRSPKAQPSILSKIRLRLRSARASLFPERSRRAGFNAAQPAPIRFCSYGLCPFTPSTTGKVPATVRGSPVLKRNPAAAPAWQPNAKQHPTSFAGTDGFAYFCHNKSRSPKAKPSTLSTKASTTLSQRKPVP